MLLRPFGQLLAFACVTWACAQEAPVPTHLRVKATFTRTDKDGKPEVLAMPSVITVDGKRATITVGNAEEGVLLSVLPKVNADGTLSEAKVASKLGSDGLAVDERGNLYTVTKEGIAIHDAEANQIGAIAVPESPSNLKFGGIDGKTLFITARTGAYIVEMKVRGDGFGK